MDKYRTLSEEQKIKIVERSQWAQQLTKSPLFPVITEWVDQELKAIMHSIAYNIRTEETEKMTRQEFVENMSGYYKAWPTLLNLLKQYAGQEEELRQYERSQSASTDGKRN